jgi:threonine/homoserine/homoserine lactone efflux protein
MDPFLEGAILGLTLAVLFGPAVVALVQTSIHRGFRSGSLLALGIFFSDLTLVFLCFMGALQILSNDYNRLVFGIISGCILIGYGIFTFARHVTGLKNGNGDTEKKPGWLTFILKGFFLNIANPFVWFWWISVTVGVTSNYGDNTRSAAFFFTGTLATVLATDLFKVYIAKKLKGFLNEKNIRRINHIVGILLIGFGLILMGRAVAYHYQWL